MQIKRQCDVDRERERRAGALLINLSFRQELMEEEERTLEIWILQKSVFINLHLPYLELQGKGL